MLCQACHSRCGAGFICHRCRLQLRPAADRVLAGGIRLIAAFEHVGPARDLAHHLKYRGLTDYAGLVAATLAPRVPRLPLVPVPRARSRLVRYGVDPALVIARLLAYLTGAPVLNALRAPLHAPRRAGGDHRRRVRPFRLANSVLENVVLVDDVVTTGATLLAAVAAVGHERVGAVVTANAVPARPRRPADTEGGPATRFV